MTETELIEPASIPWATRCIYIIVFLQYQIKLINLHHDRLYLYVTHGRKLQNENSIRELHINAA